MYKKQMTFQRVVCFLALFVSVLCFLYSLGIMTDLYDTLYAMISDPNDLDNAKVAGARVYYDMQGFNRVFLRASIGLILLSCLLFLTNTHSRRKYYIGNLVSTAVNVIGECALGFYIHTQVEMYKNQYLTTVDFEQLRRRLERKGTYTDSTFWFDIHYLVLALLILVAVLLIVNFVWKKKMMRGEQALLDGKEVIA